MKNTITYLLAMFFTGLFLISCDSQNMVSSDSQIVISSDPQVDSSPGIYRVVLTDAPAAYDAVYIDVQEVRVHSDSDADTDENEWIVIQSEPVRVNLLDLTNGRQELLGEEELQPGRYQQIRLILGTNNEIVIDGESHQLRTPGAQQSGLKLKTDAEIESGKIYTLLLDFDASRSVVKTGAGGYLLKPVIRAVQLDETGSVAGNIEPAESLPWVYTIADDDTIAGTQAEEDGDFLMIGIPSGTYQISIEPSEGEYNSTVIPQVKVSAPDTTHLDPITLDSND
ncbi:MAG: DUF4382 domain-containing protein [Balneolaceae bacterium]